MFFTDRDYEYYLELLVEWCTHEGIEIWAYCLMTNHTPPLIVKSKKKSNLGKAIGEVNERRKGQERRKSKAEVKGGRVRC